MPKKKYFTIILIFLLFIVAIVAWWDFKKVGLQYVGMVKVSPPLIGILRSEVVSTIKEGKCIVAINIGTDLKKSVKEWLSWQKKINVEIDWDKIPLEEGKIYYAGIGCKINYISYFYHSKFTNIVNDRSKFAVLSVSATPTIEQSIITIYKGDTFVADIGSNW